MSDDHNLFLPIVSSYPSIPVELHKGKALGLLIENDPLQKRRYMTWSDVLAQVAYERCMSMAHNDWYEHTDPDGHGPNWWVKQAGYILPDSYDKTDGGNNIESLVHGGLGDIESVLISWRSSPLHFAHIMGQHEGFVSQTVYGIGYYTLSYSAKKHYWSFISCPPMP